MLPFLIFTLTLFLVIKQPKGIGIGYSATAGAVLALLAGAVSLNDVWRVVQIIWDPTLAFLGIILISIVLDKIGFFEWASLHMMCMAKGDGRRLFLYIILLGAIISAFFANDGAALILTPIVYQKIKHLGLGRRAMFPFIMGSGFVADTTSLPLLISNLVNILTADFWGIGFFEYAFRMVFVNFFSFLATIVLLYLYFWRDLVKSYDVEALEDKPPKLAIKDPFLFKITWVVGILMLFGFFVSELFYRIPVSVIIVSGGVLLLVASLKNRVYDVKFVLIKETPWKIVVFSVGMYVVVYGLKNAGLTTWISRWLEFSMGFGEFVGITFTGFLSAVMSSIMNNLPSVMLVNLAIDETVLAMESKKILGYANVVGCDLGPKITPIGSLATLLWLYVLEKKGMEIGWGYYFKVGIVITIPILFFTLLGLYLVVLLLG
ncbi:MAG: arsenic transporter [Hydrogenothermaceae bacterium]|nr:arsenic transporter [Hydrogenothermaceae bacterium]